MTLHAGSGVRPECAKSGHTRTAWRTGQIDPLLPSKLGPANGMEARESGLKARRRMRGGYSATAARLPLEAWQRSPRPVASGSSRCSASTNWPGRRRLGARCGWALLELELAGRVEYLADRIALCASANKHGPHGSSRELERIVLLAQSNRRLVAKFLLRALGFGGTGEKGANKYFAFRFRHCEKINQSVEAGRVRHGFEFGGHICDVTSNVERFPRHSPVRRIVGSSRRSRGSAPSSSPIPAFRFHETHLRGQPIKLSHVRSFAKRSAANLDCHC